MRTSESVGHVMAGIALVKKAVPFVDKTATAEIVGGRSDRREKYVPFEDVAQKILASCEEARIIWTQGGREGAGGTQWLVTRIDHPESGEWVESDLRVESAKAGFREVGAALSYMRRVGLIAAFGIVAKGEDPESDKDTMRQVEQPRGRVDKAARPANVPADIGVRVETAIKEAASATTLQRLEELGKTLRDDDGQTLIPKSDRPRVKTAFETAATRIRAALEQSP